MKNNMLIRGLTGILPLVFMSCFSQSVSIPILSNTAIGAISSTSYSCEEMVQSINRLRHLGKDQALKILKSDLKEHDDEIKIMCICRLLFENTNGWKPIAGAHQYSDEIDTNIIERFPLFPMALSDGVPFFIYRGYQINGRLAESAVEDLQLCEGFPMVPSDLPGSNYAKAAVNLIKSESFLKLYRISDNTDAYHLESLRTAILWEAGLTNAALPTYTDPFTIAH